MLKRGLSLIFALAGLGGSIAALLFVLLLSDDFPFWALIAPAAFLVVSIGWIKEDVIRRPGG